MFITASFPFTVVDGAPVDRTLNSLLNITYVITDLLFFMRVHVIDLVPFSDSVKEDDSLKLPIGAERRRVFSVDQVSVDKTGSISFPPPPK